MVVINHFIVIEYYIGGIYIMLNLSKLISEYNTPDGIIRILDNMDIITLNHSIRVCEISRIVEVELFKDKKLSEAGLYHDIGKYFITPNLLNKRGKLDEMERLVINSHSYLSYKTLKLFDIDDDICLIALFHHTFDPQMLFEDDKSEIATIDTNIARLSRAIKTIDIYEALTTDRPYHRGVRSETSIRIIKETIPDCDLEVLRVIENHVNDFEE